MAMDQDILMRFVGISTQAITSASKDQNSVVLELWIPAFAGMTDYSCI
jgi:hypothetical protein